MAAIGVTTKTYGTLEKPELSTHGLICQYGGARFKGNKVTSITTKIMTGRVVFVRAFYKAAVALGSGTLALYCSGTVKGGKLSISRSTMATRITTASTSFWYEVVGFS